MSGSQDWTVLQIKEYFESQLRERDRLMDERLKYQQSADQAANQALSERLHNLNNFRESLNDAAQRNITRQEADARFRNLSEKIEIAGKPNWSFLGIAATILIGSVTGVWGLIGLQISNVASPLGLSLTEVKETGNARERIVTEMNERLRAVESSANRSSLADEQSRTDRAQVGQRVHDLEIQQSEMVAVTRAANSDIKAKLVEIETQFKGITTAHGLFVDTVEQWLSLIYEKVFDKPFPRSSYRPTFHREAG